MLHKGVEYLGYPLLSVWGYSDNNGISVMDCNCNFKVIKVNWGRACFFHYIKIRSDKYNEQHVLTMTWFDTYNEFIKNIEKVTQLQKDYVTNLERINYLYNESIKNIERVMSYMTHSLEIMRKSTERMSSNLTICRE